MKWHQRQRARLLSEYVDSLIVQRRSAGASNRAESNDRESSDLRTLCDELSRIEIRIPSDLEDELAVRIAASTTAQPRTNLLTAWRTRFREWHEPNFRLRTAPSFRVAVATLAVTLILVFYRSPTRTVSAAEVLTKAEAALAQMVRPGELMFRRWRIVDRIRETPDGPERVDTRYLAEWMDGANTQHGVGRSLDANGQVYLAYVNEPDRDYEKPLVYYKAGFSGEAHGLLSIVPTAEEFQKAAGLLPSAMQRPIYGYLARGFVPYQPIMGELRYNEAVLDASQAETPQTTAPINLSLETTTIDDGREVYRLRYVDPVRVLFRWTSEGPPKVWLARYEVVRFIDVETFLNVRTENIEQHESGRSVVSTRELIETRVVKAMFAGESPFELAVPPGVVVRQQSAYDHLMQVGLALNRARGFRPSEHEPR